jgi:hypothetical protein
MTTREITFRGLKADGSNEWIYGDLIHNYIHHKTGCSIVNGGGCIWHEVIPETVGQFTGLTDKNGTRVFDGDEIEHQDYSKGGCIGFPQFKTVSIVKIDNLMNGCNTLKGLPPAIIESSKIEVIGNIHQK